MTGRQEKLFPYNIKMESSGGKNVISLPVSWGGKRLQTWEHFLLSTPRSEGHNFREFKSILQKFVSNTHFPLS